MKAYLKGEKVGVTTTKITLQHNRLGSDDYIEKELHALFLLLGDFNTYGGEIEPEKYRELRKRFDTLLADTVYASGALK
jgi:hypothetical protein